MAATRTLVVAQNHPQASDQNPGSAERPFKTINAAAAIAQPGDTVRVHAGVYRERVDPVRGGEAGKPITYMAAPGEQVFLRGSDEFRPEWEVVAGPTDVYRAPLKGLKLGAAAYGGHCGQEYQNYNPFLHHFAKNQTARPHRAVLERLQKSIDEASAKVKQELAEGVDIAFSAGQQRLVDLQAQLRQRTGDDPRYMTTLGQVFVDGRPLVEVETFRELYDIPGTWIVSADADAILVHFPPSHRPVRQRLVEVSTRHTVFAPVQRRLGYITLRGFIIEHGANHSPAWGQGAWAQAGLISCRTGHHWVIEDCVVRYAKSVGIDCGSEGGQEIIENAGEKWEGGHAPFWEKAKSAGQHVIRSNHICDNGHCGLTGIGHYGTRVLGNVIERNNRTGYTSPWWEFGGIKFHWFFDGVIEGNLIRDNDCHGIWIDNQWRGSRITRNIIVNNLWSGINVELGRGPVMIDNNIIAYTRNGDGIYGHDLADVTIAHNLLYANANCGIWVAYCTPRVKNEDGCWDIKAFNNMILGNRGAAIGYPMPWECAGNNTSDGNLLMGGGEALDEGSGPFPPLFLFTNKTHCGQFPEVISAKFPMTVQNTNTLFRQSLEKAKVPKDQWPNLERWADTYQVSLSIWQAIMGNDKASKVMSTIRDGLQSRMISFQMKFDQTPQQVQCTRVEGVDRDYFGHAMPEHPLPGPFQNLSVGQNHLHLWPVRGVATAQVLL